MKIVLEIIAGPATGRCFAVGDDQVVTFGRTDAAHHAIPEDSMLSRKHFAMRFDPEEQAWQIRDLESRHGTSMFEERIVEEHLEELMEFTAGSSVFRLRSASDEDTTPEALAAAAAALAMFTAVAASERPPTQAAKFDRSKTQTGLATFISEEADPQPAEIAWLLTQERPLYLLADFAKAEMPFPQQLEQREFLFNWADEEVLETFSPVILSPEDPVDPYEIIDALWGKDALMCVWSTLDRPQLIQQLRAAVRMDDGTATTTPKGLAGCCWPEAARPLLTTAPERYTQPLLDGGQWYLMEAEPPKSWQLFAPKADESPLRRKLESVP